MSSFSFWLMIGFVGQGLFTARFLVQWLASEREGSVVVPPAFWWFSIFGGSALLSYAVARRDPVIILGQSMGLFVYVRNLMLGTKKKQGAVGLEARGVPAPHFQDAHAAPVVSCEEAVG